MPDGVNDEATLIPEGEAPPVVVDFDTALAALNQHLDKSQPDYEEKLGRLKGHPTIAGVAGSMAQRMKQVENEQQRLADLAAAVEQKEQELRDLAVNDPEAFAAKFLTEQDAEKARRELEDLRTKEEQRIAGHIGLAVRDLPELQQMAPAELKRMADALSGVPSDQVLGVYTRTAIDIAADKRAQARVDQELPVRLAAEQEAWNVQQGAERLRTNAPRLGTAAQPPASDEPDFRLNPGEYIEWVNNVRNNRLARRV